MIIPKRTGLTAKLRRRQLNNTRIWNWTDCTESAKPWRIDWKWSGLQYVQRRAGAALDMKAKEQMMSPIDRGKSADDLYPVWIYISHLIMTNKREDCRVDRPEAWKLQGLFSQVRKWRQFCWRDNDIPFCSTVLQWFSRIRWRLTLDYWDGLKMRSQLCQIPLCALVSNVFDGLTNAY